MTRDVRTGMVGVSERITLDVAACSFRGGLVSRLAIARGPVAMAAKS
jgi:hypothetical protein